MLRELLTLLALLPVDMPSPAGAGDQFRTVAAAMKVDQPGLRGDLSEEALKYIMDSTGLGWSTNWTKYSRDPEVRAHVSFDRAYCVACRGHFGEFGSGREVECCLIDSSSAVRWQRRIGESWARPRVSTKGHVAFMVVGEFNASTELQAYEMELVVYDSLGDTLISENLGVYVSRMVGFEELYDFNPDASLFFTTMNTRERSALPPNLPQMPRYDNTTLYVFDLARRKKFKHYLGAFRPRECGFAGGALELHGTPGVVRLLSGGSQIEWTEEKR